MTDKIIKDRFRKEIKRLGDQLTAIRVDLYSKLSDVVETGPPGLSDPPGGKCKITNLYVDPITQKLVIEYDDVPT